MGHKEMNEKFQIIADKMLKLLEALENEPPVTRQSLNNIPEKGVYIFYENGEAMYVGRSNRSLKRRIQQYIHSKPPMGFARKLGEDIKREKEGEIHEKITKENPYFEEARSRISQMQIKTVQIDDQKEQAFFELYAQIALKPKYNDFDTH